MRSSVLSLVALLVLAVPGPTQAKTLRHALPGAANFPEDSISIIGEGGTAGPDHIAELARAYDAAGLTRVLPVAGLGPIANARDLLHMRGIDLAVVDADIIAYGRLSGELPGADRGLAGVLKLTDKSVYVIAAPDIKVFTDLRGQKVLSVGEDSDGHVTALTMFSLLGLEIDLGSASLAAASAALTSGSAKALVLVAGPGQDALSRLPKDKGLHLLPTPAVSALDTLYGHTLITEADAPGFAPAGGVPGLKVSNMLATYSWRPNFYRYGPVQQFLRALPGVLSELRANDVSGFWQSVDAHAIVPGWQAYDGATVALATVAPAAAPLPAMANLVATAPAAAPPPAHPSAPPAPGKPSAAIAGGIDLVGHRLPGLADPDAPGGGLFAELVRAGLDGDDVRLTWAADAAGVTRELEVGGGARLGLALPRPDCETAAGKSLCQRFVFSKSVFQALDVFFVRHGSDFTFVRDEDVAGHSVCAPADADTTALDAAPHHWLKEEMITLLRKPSLADCLAAVDQGSADAVFADQMAGEAQIATDGLAGRIEVAGRPVAIRDLVAAALKSSPSAEAVIARLDAGLASLKTAGRYAAIVLRRLGHPQVVGQGQAQR